MKSFVAAKDLLDLWSAELRASEDSAARSLHASECRLSRHAARTGALPIPLLRVTMPSPLREDPDGGLLGAAASSALKSWNGGMVRLNPCGGNDGYHGLAAQSRTGAVRGGIPREPHR